MKTYNERIEEIRSKLLDIADQINDLSYDTGCKTDLDELRAISKLIEEEIDMRLSECKY